jgi:hypothetical protein
VLSFDDTSIFWNACQSEGPGHLQNVFTGICEFLSQIYPGLRCLSRSRLVNPTHFHLQIKRRRFVRILVILIKYHLPLPIGGHKSELTSFRIRYFVRLRPWWSFGLGRSELIEERTSQCQEQVFEYHRVFTFSNSSHSSYLGRGPPTA